MSDWCFLQADKLMSYWYAIKVVIVRSYLRLPGHCVCVFEILVWLQSCVYGTWLLCVLFSVLALNFPFNTRCSNEQLKNVLLLFGFQDKCPIEFVLSRTFVLLQSTWKWAPDIHTCRHTHIHLYMHVQTHAHTHAPQGSNPENYISFSIGTVMTLVESPKQCGLPWQL